MSRPTPYLFDVLASTVRMMRLAVLGPDERAMRWVRFDVTGLTEKRLWWVAHAMSASPATVAVFRSEDGRWLFTHTMLATERERLDFVRDTVTRFTLRGGDVARVVGEEEHWPGERAP
ncbi:MAG: hypothetical protein Q8N26_06210 [Myxococcales bacterium]|nr:hypothetical protein [Myxococcales bacterium]